MLAKQQDRSQRSLFFSLESTLNHDHPLFILANKIDWAMFEREFSPLYCPDNGRPAKPIRLMVGLLILKHVRDLSDENVVEQWSENNYYKGITGDEINVMLAAARFNFKRMMNKWKSSFWLFLEQVLLFMNRQLVTTRTGIILQTKENWAF